MPTFLPADMRIYQPARVMSAHCGCNHSSCTVCNPASPHAPECTSFESYGDETVWTPNGSIVCKHDWKPARVKGKKQWCSKCGEYE